jgi:phosphoglycolate/pyridoxal phosphate phosphatase family enzyme
VRSGATSAGGPAAAGAPGRARAGVPAPLSGRATRARIRLVALDLDGVVYRGNIVLPGVAEALEDVLRRGLDLRYVSNNSTAHRETVSERLAGMGVPAGVERVLTSGFVTGRWLRARLPAGAPVMVIGEAGLMRELREAGLDAYHVGEPDRPPAGGSAATPVSGASAFPAAVVVGMDRTFSFGMLAAAQAAVKGGALFVATNRDATFPAPDGVRPGAGAIVAAVATAAQSEPVLMGKPSLPLAEILATITGIPSSQTLFIGDRLSTDIAMGRAAGMITALVMTGVTGEAYLDRVRVADAASAEGARGATGSAEDATGDTGSDGATDRAGGAALPDYVLADLGELSALLDRLT